jgi:tripartite-type tricarboxylate transporter receptor subunit TctC
MSDEVSVCAVTGSSGFSEFKDLFSKQLIVGASGAGGDTSIFPRLLNGVLGTKMKVVNGYPGGNDINLAMERGEVAGRCGWSWSSLVATHGKKIESGQLRLLTQLGLSKHPDLPEVPLALDLASTDEQRSSLQLIFARQAMAWPFALPPGTPPSRLKDMREAFVAATSDGELLAEAKKMELEVRPVSGAKIDEILSEAYLTPDAIVSRTAEFVR